MKLVDKLEKYIERAGQVKSLEDSEHRTKESYFEVVQENKKLEEQLNNGLICWLRKL